MTILRFGNSATIHQNVLNCSIEKQMEDLLIKDHDIIDFDEEVVIELSLLPNRCSILNFYTLFYRDIISKLK